MLFMTSMYRPQSAAHTPATWCRSSTPGCGWKSTYTSLTSVMTSWTSFSLRLTICSLLEKQVGRVDGVGVDLQPVAEVHLVVHAHGVEEDVDVVAGRHLREHRQVLPRSARRAAPLGAGDEELELAVAGGHGHMLVLDVAELAEDLPDGDDLMLEADQVDVAVLALRELQVDGVVPHGQPAGEPEHHAALVARVDDGARLRHEALVTADGGVERRVVQAGGGVCVHASRFYPPRPAGEADAAGVRP